MLRGPMRPSPPGCGCVEPDRVKAQWQGGWCEAFHFSRYQFTAKARRRFATDGAPMNTDSKENNLNLSVFIGAPSVAKDVFAVAFPLAHRVKCELGRRYP